MNAVDVQKDSFKHICIPSERAPSKIVNHLSKAMHNAASPRKKERLSPSPCMHTASIWGEGTFCLDREFSKNAPYYRPMVKTSIGEDGALQNTASHQIDHLTDL